MKRFLLDYLELILTAIGLIICALLIGFIESDSESKWHTIAVVAIVVGVLHGIIFFAVRHRQRKVRHEAIFEVGEMLRDRVTNHLTVVTALSHSQEDAHRHEVDQALREITTLVNSLSEDSLSSWKQRYANLLHERGIRP